MYYGIIASIIVISFVISVYKHSLKSFFTTFWSYLSVILSDYYSLPIKTVIDKQLSGVWLISCTVLLAAFSGQLRQQQMEPKPIQWIDSIEQLLFDDNWKHLDIDNSVLTYLTQGLRNNPRHYLWGKFKNKVRNPEHQKDAEALIRGTFPSCDTILSALDKVKNGSLALIHQYTILKFCLRDSISDDFKEDIDSHISRQSFQPLFTQTNPKKLNKNLEGKLALV